MRANWGNDIPIVGSVQKDDTVYLPVVPFSRLRCLTVGVWNISEFEIEDAEVEVRIFFGDGFTRRLMNWLDPTSLQADEISTISWHEKCKEIRLTTTDKSMTPQDLMNAKQTWKTHGRSIKPFKIDFADILFTVEGHYEAYLTDDETTAIPLGREYKIRLVVFGSNIRRPNVTRMHLQLNSWNDMSLSYDTLGNAFLRFLKKGGHERLLGFFLSLAQLSQ